MRRGGYQYYYLPRRSAAIGGATGAARLLGAEADGVALDFTDLSARIRDTATPANTYSGNVNDWLTYTSPSTKWILGSNGRYSSGTTLRTEYNASGTALGVRIEPAATNLLLNSAFTLGGASGTPGAAPTSWVFVGNTGSLDIGQSGGQFSGQARIKLSTTASREYLVQAITLAAGTQYVVTARVDIESGSNPVTQYLLYQSAPADLVVSYRLDGAVWTVGNVSTGRHELTMLLSSALGGTITLRVGSGVSDNATGVVYVEHIQAETGTVATSPIVTAGSTVTRAADDIRAPVTLFPYSNAASTLFANAYSSFAGPSFGRLVMLSNGNTAFFIDIADNSADLAATVSSTSSSFSEAIKAGSLAAGESGKAAIAAAANNAAAAYSGSVTATDTSVTMPATDATNLYIGYRSVSGAHWNRHIKQIMYLPRRMSNAELQTVTT